MTSAYLFRYWQPPASGTPGYLPMCLETQEKNAARGATPVLLDWESCLDWVPDRDSLWAISKPRAEGKSTDLESRRIAIFSDLLRLRLLHRHGGVWMDADTLALPGAHVIVDAAQRYDFVASTFGEFAIMNGVMGARKGSRFLAVLNAEIDRALDDPEREETGWGEYGFRLFSHLIAEADPETCLILPSGSLNQNLHDRANDYFAIGSKPPTLGALTLCISLHNASTPQSDRDLTTESLRIRECAFTRLYDIACAPRAFEPKLSDFEAVNQAEFALSMLDRKEKANNEIARLKSNSATLKAKLQAANARVQDLKARLLDVRETTRLALVELNAQGLLPRKEVFSKIHALHLWNSAESVSGCGSTMRQTETLRAQLRPFLDKHKITSLLDIPCGDLNWMQDVDLTGVRYIGADIVAQLIADNRKSAPDGMEFLVADIVEDPLPTVDCVMVRDCFSHLPFADVSRAMSNIARSGAKWALITHFTDRAENAEIAAGDFHPLNLCTAPFFLPPPSDVLVEEHPNPKNADKTLALWPAAALAKASVDLQGATR